MSTILNTTDWAATVDHYRKCVETQRVHVWSVLRAHDDQLRIDLAAALRERDEARKHVEVMEAECHRIETICYEQIAELNVRSVPCSQCGKETGSLGRRLSGEIGMRQQAQKDRDEARARVAELKAECIRLEDKLARGSWDALVMLNPDGTCKVCGPDCKVTR